MKRCKFIICIILLLILNCYFFKVYADSNENQLKVNNLNLGTTLLKICRNLIKNTPV